MTTTLTRPQPIALAEGQNRIIGPKNGILLIDAGASQGSITIRWKQGQAVVELQDAQVQVSSPGELSFHCERFCVQADQSIELQSQGRVHATAMQDMQLSAQSLSLRATLGDLMLRANDFVRAIGEKILLNTDTCPEASRRHSQAYLARLLGHRSPQLQTSKPPAP